MDRFKGIVSVMTSIFASTLRKSKFIKRSFHTTKPLMFTDIELSYGGKCFDGELRYYHHYSETVNCKMNFSVYLPPKSIQEKKECPVLYFLNGRTANHQNFVLKSGFQILASKFNICTVSPDTSPRDVDIPDRDNLGSGASFYVDTTEEPWCRHYQMFSYVTNEFMEVINANFPVIKNKQSIAGLSMGGYGALICFLKNPGLYKSISVFAPVCNPLANEMGRLALQTYFGCDKHVWRQWDPCELVRRYKGTPIEILLDQGTDDLFYKENYLLPENLVNAAKSNKYCRIIYKLREGYDHSHYFLSTFIDEHMEYHARFLNCV